MKKIFLILILLCCFTSSSISQVKYQLYADSAVIAISRQTLREQVGIKELTGHNDGKQVESYLRSVNLIRGNPWCQALQYYCYYIAVKLLGLPSSYIPIPKSGLANDVYRYAKQNGHKVKYKAEIDDLIVYRLNNSNSKGHIARTDSVGKSGWVTTIEGNTSNDLKGNQREGNGCFKKTRNIFHPISTMYIKCIVGIKPE